MRELIPLDGLGDPYFVEKVRGIAGRYRSPPEKAVVLCIDEKPPVQALGRTQPVLPMAPARIERATHDYARPGTASLFAALDVATGKVIGRCHRRHRHQELLRFLDHVDATPVREPGVTVHVVLDNDGTHKTPAVKRWFLRHPEYHLHFTPTSASWLNQVERFFAAITEDRIRRGGGHQRPATRTRHPRLPGRTQPSPHAVRLDRRSRCILERVKRVIQRTSDSGH